ncbi:hypothetical protein [Sphingomonas sp. PvP055]|uniref:hypothetical protein n=1 Tax=Sphingomonas sp. PvP055 TaxID=3156391 RepID=UPI0033994FE7
MTDELGYLSVIADENSSVLAGVGPSHVFHLFVLRRPRTSASFWNTMVFFQAKHAFVPTRLLSSQFADVQPLHFERKQQ